MCLGPKVPKVKETPPPPPAPEPAAILQMDDGSGISKRSSSNAKRFGTALLRNDLAIPTGGVSGLNIPL